MITACFWELGISPFSKHSFTHERLANERPKCFVKFDWNSVISWGFVELKGFQSLSICGKIIYPTILVNHFTKMAG